MGNEYLSPASKVMAPCDALHHIRLSRHKLRYLCSLPSQVSVIVPETVTGTIFPFRANVHMGIRRVLSDAAG